MLHVRAATRALRTANGVQRAANSAAAAAHLTHSAHLQQVSITTTVQHTYIVTHTITLLLNHRPRLSVSLPSLQFLSSFSSPRFVSGGRSRFPSADGSTRRVTRNGGGGGGVRRHSAAVDDDGEDGDFNEIESYDNDMDQPDGEEANEDAKLWSEISQQSSKPKSQPSSSSSSHTQRNTQTQSSPKTPSTSTIVSSTGVDTSASSSSSPASSYTAYRPYSDPRSQQLVSSEIDAPKPRYSSSRMTPAQLAFKKKEEEASAATTTTTISESNENRHPPSTPPPSSSSFSSSSFSSTSFSGGRWSSPSSSSAMNDSNRFETRRSEEGFRERVGVTDRRTRKNNNYNNKGYYGESGNDRRGDDMNRGWSGDASSFNDAGAFRDGGLRRRSSSEQATDDWSPRHPTSNSRHSPRPFDRSIGSSSSSSSSSFGRHGNDSERFSQFQDQRNRLNGLNQLQPTRGELLYGFHPVMSALRSRKRSNFYRLYLQENKAARVGNHPTVSTTSNHPHGPVPSTSDSHLNQVLSLARSLNLPVTYLSKHELNLAAEHRPHNGFILDVEPLKLEIIHAPKDLGELNDEENMNSNTDVPRRRGSTWLLLDEVVDPQNLGAMLRSSWYFGVSGVLLCSKNSAPLSPVTSKASSGAQEVLKMLAVASTPRFLHKLKLYKNWRIIGLSLQKGSIDLRELGPPTSGVKSRTSSSTTSSTAEVGGNNDVDVDGDVDTEPIHTLLVVGNEGRGLRPLVASSCHILAKIVGQSSLEHEEEDDGEDGIESDALSGRETQLNAWNAANINDQEEAEFGINKNSSDFTTTNTNMKVRSSSSPSSSGSQAFVDSLNVSNALAIALFQITRPN